MKVLSNCSLIKLREYSQSYGSPEKITMPYIKEFANEIWLCNNCGEHIRTMKIGTKLLISYSGIEITQRQLTGRANKAIEKRTGERLHNIELNKIAQQTRQLIVDQQAAAWIKFIAENPQSKAKYIDKANTMPSGKWRNYLRLKAAKHINDGKFEGLAISAPELKALLY